MATKTVTIAYKYPLVAKALYWGKLITLTGGAQVLVQAAGLLAGIVIIRLLSTTEYAYYTLANTMLGIITMLSDGGVSNGVLAQGGRVWQDRQQLGVVLATGLALRRRFAVGALAVGIPILAFLLLRNGAGWLTTGLIVAALLPSVFAAVSDSLLEVVPKLHQQMKPLQANQSTVSIGRLLATGVCLVALPYTWVAVLVNGVVRAVGNVRLKRIAYTHADETAQPDPQTQTEIVRAVRRILPLTLYYCLSGQLIIWIPSLLGNTTGVAQVGALSRLAMVLNLISILVSTLILPRFARMAVTSKGQLIRSIGLIQALLFGICGTTLAIFALFPDQFLWVLGKPYSNLNRELLLLILANCISTIAHLTGNVIASRGWYINPALIISINVLSLIGSLYVFDLTTTVGVLYYTILLGAATYLTTLGYGIIRIVRTTDYAKT